MLPHRSMSERAPLPAVICRPHQASDSRVPDGAGWCCSPRSSGRYAQASLRTGGVGAQIYILIFQAAPQALHKNIIHAATFAVHADPDAGSLQHAGEGRAGKLGTLVAVEDLRSAVKS